MQARNPLIGFCPVVFAVIGLAYVGGSLADAFASGQSRGRLGAVHPAGSAQFGVHVLACFLGIGFNLLLGYLGLRNCGWRRADR